MESTKHPGARWDGIPSLRDLLAVVFKHKLGSAILFLIIVSVVTTITYVRPFMYRASSKILIKFERDEVPLSRTSQVSRPILTMRSAEEDIRTEMEILSSKHLIEAVVNRLASDLSGSGHPEPTTFWARTRSQIAKIMGTAFQGILQVGYRLGLMRELTPTESLLRSVQQNLEIEAIGDSNVIRISYSSSRPDLCAKVVNTMTELYLEQHLNVHKTPRAQEFFTEQKTLWEERLGAQEKEILEFREKWSLSSIELERGTLLESISTAMMENDRLQAEIEDAEERRDSLKKQMTERTNYIEPDKVSPALLAVDTVYRNLDNERLMTESTLQGLVAKSQLYEKQLQSYRNRLDVLDQNEIQLKGMDRELAIFEDNYKTYCGKLEETRISEALDLERISNVTVIEPAIVPFEPIRIIPFLPTRVLHILAGVIVGLLSALGYAFLTEQMNHTFSSREDVDRMLNIRCLVSIPKE